MPIGIRPLVDMAFKKTFGQIENKICLISLLNSILTLKSPIVDVTIENPYNEKDFETDKLSILDIKATDQSGAIYDIEVQLAYFVGLVKRIVFYGSKLYSSQLKEGDDYRTLKPVFAICLLDGTIWSDSTTLHHRFQFHDRETGRTLDDTIEVHALELSRFKLTEADLPKATLKERWLFWLLHASEYDSARLLELFPAMAFQQATNTITKISEQTEDKAMYDAREKHLLDEQWKLNAARDEGREEGVAIGEARGVAIGEAKGREEGVAIGEARSNLREFLRGRITVFRQLLGLTEFTSEEFQKYDEASLKKLEADLQLQLRSRNH